MTLARIRSSARRLAVVMVAVSLWSLPHVTQADDVCRPAAEAHDESKHIVTSETDPAGHAEHCAVCHWMRSLKPDLSARAAAAHDSVTDSSLVPAAQPAALRDVARALAARAPPALL